MAANMEDVREIFAKWERLRVVYNLILLATTLGLMFMDDLVGRVIDPLFFLYLLTRCVAANVLFMAGPGVESYASWLGLRHRATRPVLFALGVLLSLPLTIVSIGVYGIPAGD